MTSSPSANPLQDTIGVQGALGWDVLWKKGNTPWDRAQPNAFLVKLLESPPAEVILPEKGQKGIRALVAGCGRGYDAEAFSRLGGWTSWGVDLSETAIKEANAWYSSLPAPSLTSGPVSYHTLDFFTFPLPSPTAFSVAFDHTFLCALPPTLRSSWAARYADLLPKPGSLLVTMVWPIFADGDERKGTGKGPPWEVDVGVYEGLLLEEQAGKWVKKWEGDGGDIGRLVVWERI